MRNIFIDTAKEGGKINKNIYGHFSEHLGRCIYEGMFVGKDSAIPNVNGMRTDVVEALRQIKSPVLRWPGGCFADEYHWMDGIGPKEERKTMINTHWGGVVEDNSFGTHEFMELCGQIGCDPFISGNMGSGTVREMSEWVEYMTFDGVSPMADLRRKHGREAPWSVPFFGIGNESWGCGGNMTPEYYAAAYRHYQTYVREYGDNKIAKIACGPNRDDYNWTEVLMTACHCEGMYIDGPVDGCNIKMDGLSLHYYTSPGGPKGRGSATCFDEEKYFHTISDALRMDTLIKGHSQVMDRFDPEKHVGLVVDEWGTWFDVEGGTNPGFLYQQNTMRDALVAAVTLNIFNQHCDRVIMANIAQTVNVLQAVILTQGEEMLLTPTYHVFDLYKDHQNATLLESTVETETIGTNAYAIPDLHVSSSQDENGRILMTLANLSLSEIHDICCQVAGQTVGSVHARILTEKMDAHNDFHVKDRVKPREFTDITVANGKIQFRIPPCAIMEVQINP